MSQPAKAQNFSKTTVGLILPPLLASTVMRKAYEKGCMFDSWSEYFHNDLWLESFEECGLDIGFYTTRQRMDDEIFPWDFIDCGVARDFLLREWKKAQNQEGSPNCKVQCQGCGANRFGVGICYEKDCKEVTA